LILPHSTDSLVIGAVALKPGSTPPEPLGFELLQVLGQALYGLNDHSRSRRHSDSRSS
jgi:hypothetical protein